jgi:imidazolonepropionase-like amidohydrolase
MTPELYRATIDQAHKHQMKVVMHATALPDVKDLMRAGIDGLRTPTDVDDELMAMLRKRISSLRRRLARRDD